MWCLLNERPSSVNTTKHYSKHQVTLFLRPRCRFHQLPPDGATDQAPCGQRRYCHRATTSVRFESNYHHRFKSVDCMLHECRWQPLLLVVKLQLFQLRTEKLTSEPPGALRGLQSSISGGRRAAQVCYSQSAVSGCEAISVSSHAIPTATFRSCLGSQSRHIQEASSAKTIEQLINAFWLLRIIEWQERERNHNIWHCSIKQDAAKSEECVFCYVRRFPHRSLSSVAHSPQTRTSEESASAFKMASGTREAALKRRVGIERVTDWKSSILVEKDRLAGCCRVALLVGLMPSASPM